jgi:mannose-1-phosphate guanylyltransferase/mannose-6-phosphate isomerase
MSAKSPICPVILSGGSGTRLWPLSREQYPKQLLELSGELSMLQATASRLKGLAYPDGVAAPIVVCNEEHRFITAQQLHEIGCQGARILLEPCGRNTAPALTLAALICEQAGGDPVMLVMPADHVIPDAPAFHEIVLRGAARARAGAMVTFGVQPTRPETGYGYIRTGETCGSEVFQIQGFVEKPVAEVAEQYVSCGQYLWNSGLFMMRASVWLRAIGHFQPDILRACRGALGKGRQDKDFSRLDPAEFAACPSDSIDYAVMEKLAAAPELGIAGNVVAMNTGWSDVGAWDAIWDLAAKDSAGNAVKGDVCVIDAKDNLIFSRSRLVACVGIEGMVVVETPDAVLVSRKDATQNVKHIVSRLKSEQRTEISAHRKVYRPWGHYDSVDCGERFQVKRIVVNPGASLSLQMHHHRAEHWVVVKGQAKVTCGESVLMLSENQSTYIPMGTKHRLENPGDKPLEIIEIQSGSYLGEDDIVRFEDNYGRS